MTPGGGHKLNEGCYSSAYQQLEGMDSIDQGEGGRADYMTPGRDTGQMKGGAVVVQWCLPAAYP